MNKLCNQIKASSILLLLICSSGCGTFITRTGSQHFGAFPYQSVGVDVEIASSTFIKPDAGAYGLGYGLISVLPDLAIDTILLPVDLIWWARGKAKNGFLSGVE